MSHLAIFASLTLTGCSFMIGGHSKRAGEHRIDCEPSTAALVADGVGAAAGGGFVIAGIAEFAVSSQPEGPANPMPGLAALVGAASLGVGLLVGIPYGLAIRRNLSDARACKLANGADRMARRRRVVRGMTLVNDAVLAARAGDCAGARAFTDEVRALGSSVLVELLGHPDLDRCNTAPSTDQPHCLEVTVESSTRRGCFASEPACTIALLSLPVEATHTGCTPASSTASTPSTASD